MPGWVTEPPINVQDDDEYLIAARLFIQHMRQHGTPRARDAADVAEMSLDYENVERFVYRYATLNDVILPLALLAGKLGDDHYCVEALASSPAAEGSGGIMMEFAVNRSQALGKSGIIELITISEAAGEAYKAWGFAYDNKGGHKVNDNMRLDPAKRADKWVRLAGRWRLRKYAGTTHWAA